MQDVLTNVEKIVSVAYATYVAKAVGAGKVFFMFFFYCLKLPGLSFCEISQLF